MANVRENTLRLQFRKSDLQPTNYEIHRFLVDTLAITLDSMECLEFDLNLICVFVKMTLESRFDLILARHRGEIPFRYSNGKVIDIVLSDAAVTVKAVKVKGLPFEVPESKISEAFSKYGQVRQVTKDVWQDQYFPNLPNGDRTVVIELKTPVPSRIGIAGLPAQISYVGQEPTCHYCHAPGHFVASCPRKSRSRESTSNSQSQSAPPVIPHVTEPPASQMTNLNNYLSSASAALPDPDLATSDDHAMEEIQKALDLDQETDNQVIGSLTDPKNFPELMPADLTASKRKNNSSSRSPSPKKDKKKANKGKAVEPDNASTPPPPST